MVAGVRGEASARRASLGATPADRMIDLGYQPERMLIKEIDKYPAHLHNDLPPGWVLSCTSTRT
ncbi:hypothetical protein [Cryobacterium sp. Y57]|uniref:hypothetical protein n=1 Tax=Cryobacterium sp. Y57 TaxID=2048287 RepID=UPI000CE455B1|nr:hypothetical protein [Cryobacterium sp. Y57]